MHGRKTRVFDWPIYLQGLYGLLAFGFLGWLLSLARHNVTHVDSMWSLFFVVAALIYGTAAGADSVRYGLVMALVVIWAARLFVYLTWRNWGPHEDHRYQAIRRNNEPRFWLKSLYIIFGLQAVLAWIVSLPLHGAIHGTTSFNWLDILGAVLVLSGLLWETIADWQLARFKANPENKGKVMDRGLWAYSRHPNYFGEFCVWWGFFLIACAAGAWWSLAAPLLMTLLLLKVSGVALLEKDIGERRPKYAEYAARTNAFFPGPPRQKGSA
jgi:steroid 5-alpha reductase family enzyme